MRLTKMRRTRRQAGEGRRTRKDERVHGQAAKHPGGAGAGIGGHPISALVVTGIGLEVRGADVVEDQAGRPKPGMSRMCGRSGRRKLDLTNTGSRRFQRRVGHWRDAGLFGDGSESALPVGSKIRANTEGPTVGWTQPPARPAT